MRSATGSVSVSVVIATHERPELLRAALDAVLGQDHCGPIECIVVFDRSVPDPSLEQLSTSTEFAGPRSIRTVANDNSPGLAGARNTGIGESTAPWIAFCDDDDVWTSSKLTQQFRALAERPAGVCVTGIVVLYGDHETVRLPPGERLTIDELVTRRVTAAHPSTVLVERTHLLDRVGTVDEEIPGSYAEDYDWMLRAARVGDITVVREPLVRVRWGASKFSKDWPTIVDAIDYLVAKHPEFGSSHSGMARMRGRRAIGEAARGHRRQAVSDATAAIRLSWRDPRPYVALAVASKLVSSDRLLDMAHRRGRGI